MPGNVVTRAEAVTAEWLAAALGRPVTAFSAETSESAWSRQVRLRVQVADDAEPRALRLKVCAGSTFGRSEVDYYTRDYADLADAPLLRCYDAVYDPAVGYHLLLDDVEATHRNQHPIPPTRDFGLSLAEALAILHAHHWQAHPPPDTATLDRYFATIRPGLAPLLAAAALDERARRRIAATFAAQEAAMRARAADPAGMTLIHGDPNPGNLLAPTEGDGPLYLIDRQPFDWSLTVWLAVYDLAYAIALWWPTDTRAAHEREIVERWHAVLHARGGMGYPLERVWDDYRLCVAQCLHVPVEWCANPDDIERMRWVWEPQLTRLRAALDTRWSGPA